MTPLENYLAVGAILFVLGAIGFLTRRNLIVLFLSAEMMLQGVTLNLVAFARDQRIDVLEYLVGVKVPHEPVADTTGDPGAVLAAIGNEQAAGGRRRRPARAVPAQVQHHLSGAAEAPPEQQPGPDQGQAAPDH